MFETLTTFETLLAAGFAIAFTITVAIIVEDEKERKARRAKHLPPRRPVTVQAEESDDCRAMLDRVRMNAGLCEESSEAEP